MRSAVSPLLAYLPLDGTAEGVGFIGAVVIVGMITFFEDLGPNTSVDLLERRD